MSVKALTTHVRNASTAEEKVLAEKVEPLFGDEKSREAAVRYGRKLLRVKEGKRTSAPPLAGLTKPQADQVAAALGVEKKKAAPKKSAKKTTTAKKTVAKETAPKTDEPTAEGNGEVPAEALADVEVTPDPKPEKKQRRTLAR